MEYSEKRKIFIHGLSNRGGGSETFLLNLIKYLDLSNEYRVYIAISTERKNEYIENYQNTEFFYIPERVILNPFKRIVFENVQMTRMIREISPELIFVASEIIPPIWKILQHPIIINYHSTIQISSKKRFFNRNIRENYEYYLRLFSLKIATKIICVSHLSKAEINFKFNIKEEKFSVIYHGAKPMSTNAKRVFDFSYFLSVGDRYEHKNYELLIDIYSVCRKKYNISEHLVIVGRSKNKNYDDVLNSIIKRKELEEYIHFVDYVNYSDMQNYYAFASLYVVSSNWESFGLTPLEAISQNIPTMIIARSSLSEVYNNVVHFFDPDFETIDEISRKCIDVMNGYNTIDNKIIYRNFVEKMTWQNSVNRYIRLFERIINESEKLR